MAKFWDSDLVDMVSAGDFADVITCASPALSFSAIFEYVWGEEFGFGARQIPTLTATTSSVSTLAQDNTLVVPASAIDTSSVSMSFKITSKQPDNGGMTILTLESA